MLSPSIFSLRLSCKSLRRGAGLPVVFILLNPYAVVFNLRNSSPSNFVPYLENAATGSPYADLLALNPSPFGTIDPLLEKLADN